MAGSHDDLRLVGIRDEIHGAAHAFEDFAGDHIVGQVAVGADLEGLRRELEIYEVIYVVNWFGSTYTQDGYVNVAAADHPEGFGAVECCGAGDEGYCFFAGVDDVAIRG
jgi:hypothetical protein